MGIVLSTLESKLALSTEGRLTSTVEKLDRSSLKEKNPQRPSRPKPNSLEKRKFSPGKVR